MLSEEWRRGLDQLLQALPLVLSHDSCQSRARRYLRLQIAINVMQVGFRSGENLNIKILIRLRSL